MSYGKFRIEHFDRDGKIIDVYQGTNKLRTDAFNLIFRNNFSTTDKTLEVNYNDRRDIVYHTDKDNIIKSSLSIFNPGASIPKVSTESNISSIIGGYNEFRLCLLTESGLNKVKENDILFFKELAPSLKNYLFSHNKTEIDELLDYDIYEEYVKWRPFYCYADSDNPEYDPSKHFVLAGLKEVQNYSENLIIKDVKPEDKFYTIQYTLTFNNTFINNCSNNIPLKAVTITHGYNYYRSSISREYAPFIFRERYENHKVVDVQLRKNNYIYDSDINIATLGDIDKELAPGEQFKISYDITFNFNIPRNGLESQLTLPEEIFGKVDPIGIKINFVKQKDDTIQNKTFIDNWQLLNCIDDYYKTRKYNYSCHTLINIHSLNDKDTIENNLKQLWSLTPENCFDNFDINKYFPKYNSDTNTIGNFYVGSGRDSVKFELWDSFSSSDLKSRFKPSVFNRLNTLSDKPMYGFIINCLSPVNNRLWYNWIIRFDRPLIITYEQQEILKTLDGYLYFMLPIMSFFHDIENNNSLNLIEDEYKIVKL